MLAGGRQWPHGTWGHTDAHQSIPGSWWGVCPKPQRFQPKAAVLALPGLIYRHFPGVDVVFFTVPLRHLP